MLFGWGENKVIKTKNLTPQTNPLGTQRCFVHPWRLGGPTVWGNDFPPLVVMCPPALVLGGRFPTLGRPPHSPWVHGFVCRHLTHFLCPYFSDEGPTPRLRYGRHLRWAVDQAKQRGRGRLRWLPWVPGRPGGRNGIARDEIATITASLKFVARWWWLPVAL